MMRRVTPVKKGIVCDAYRIIAGFGRQVWLIYILGCIKLNQLLKIILLLSFKYLTKYVMIFDIFKLLGFIRLY